ncbi:carotenoid oxygenase [Tothia fuscella]|uniref:Carotenoid oxygenase n=1 Tax=Tothia fuscella TaxID=1048955 RepID=A0A9P4P2V1_9PEZI|nr:carotenoid oxygenase [Tothia fuscella]
MMGSMALKRKRGGNHPYLSGNFAPVRRTLPLTPCKYIGAIPSELTNGQYVRNGGNPVTNEELGREAHWFDGDGMLSGILFKESPAKHGDIEPQFVNQYILTDCLLSSITSPSLKSPILPSIATMVNPASSLLWIIWRVIRTLLLVLLSYSPGSKLAIKRISVANTGLFYHDGRALATCESGPPLRVQLPNLETVGWYNGNESEGESHVKLAEEAFGGTGVLSWMQEWTTGHPKVDPETKELLLYHCTFIAPYIHYTIVPTTTRGKEAYTSPAFPKLMNKPIPGVSGAKMMHDFGVSRQHTVIMDLPLSLNPFNLLKNKPVVAYDSSEASRFGVFPRRNPSAIRWFETSACCIFHTANTWDQVDHHGQAVGVNMLACRLTSASLVFSAGNVAAPQPTKETADKIRKALPRDGLDHASDLESSRWERTPLLQSQREFTPEEESEQCRLYYYYFSLTTGKITHQYGLSAIPFEFPTLNPTKEMSTARYIYGCSTSASSFGAALGRAVKIDVIAKIDALALIEKARIGRPTEVTGCVDRRSVAEVLSDNEFNVQDPVRCFKMPEGWYAQEARFVARDSTQSEDDGFLLFYAFDEAQMDEDGECPDNAVSQLWVLDAKGMRDVICKVTLPQRVPYGLHGGWFSEEQIAEQREVEIFRKIPALKTKEQRNTWDRIREAMIGMLG